MGGVGPIAAQVELEEREWTATCALLNRDAQMIHNDLHPGNVLFNASTTTFHFLDFEEAASSWLSPVMDLSWVIERFCLMQESGADELVRALLDGYASAGGRVADRGASDIVSCIRLRCLIAIGLLSRQAADDRELLDLSESKKFVHLLSRLDDWTDVLRTVW
jgi:Ser/Thr protein kinase RdoA (MazF antagonist)